MEAIRGRREAALALHRAQLAELDRDLELGRLLPSEHAAAKLEVQRRLLAEAGMEEAAPRRSSRIALFVAAGAVPAVALGLYLTVGRPGFPPPESHDAQLIDQLRTELATMDPTQPRTQEGYQLLGRVELERGHLAAAGEAWKVVLAHHFDPTLAAETAEVLTEASARITPEARALFQRALAEAPPDAPWRPMVQKRLAGREGG